MKQLDIVCILLFIYSIPLNGSAGEESRHRSYSITLASSPCSSNTSPRSLTSPRKPSPRTPRSVDESSMLDYKKELSQADSERLREAYARIDAMEISMIDIPFIIDIDTENYLYDLTAPFRLAYIEVKLRTLAPHQDRYSIVRTKALFELEQLVDYAAEGTLQDHISPYNYMEFIRARPEEDPESSTDDMEPISESRRFIINALLVAAAYRNIRTNHTYSAIRECPKQNRFLKESDEFLDAYYEELGRPRKGILSVSPKKKRGSFFHGISQRLSRHKRSASAALL